MPRASIKVIADILQHELALADSQVLIYNQRFELPASDALQVTVACIDTTIIGNNTRCVVTTTGMNEVNELAVRETFQIDLFSANTDARTRKEEAIMALASLYAEQQCCENYMHIARKPVSFVDASDVEGPARINRYTATIVVNAIYTKTHAADYYGTFTEPEVTHNV